MSDDADSLPTRVHYDAAARQALAEAHRKRAAAPESEPTR
jgi:hypothetical protein